MKFDDPNLEYKIVDNEFWLKSKTQVMGYLNSSMESFTDDGYIKIIGRKKENIKVEWMDYRGYKEYNQLFFSFEHGVSILDLIFNEGENAPKFMKSFK